MTVSWRMASLRYFRCVHSRNVIEEVALFPKWLRADTAHVNEPIVDVGFLVSRKRVASCKPPSAQVTPKQSTTSAANISELMSKSKLSSSANCKGPYWKGRSPVWVRKCLCKPPRRLNWRPQTWQLNLHCVVVWAAAALGLLLSFVVAQLELSSCIH